MNLRVRIPVCVRENRREKGDWVVGSRQVGDMEAESRQAGDTYAGGRQAEREGGSGKGI